MVNYKAFDLIKATAVGEVTSNSTLEEFTEALANQKGINMERMENRKKREVLEMDIYIITFYIGSFII